MPVNGFACADFIAGLGDWRWAFLAAGISAALAWLLVALAVPRRDAPVAPKGEQALFDFRPVFRNRSAMAYAIAYGIHTLEMKEAEHCTTIAPQLLTPAPGATVSSPVTFSWTAVPGAIAYEVSAALDDGEPVFVGETSGTTLTAHLGEGRVTWMVDAELNGCETRFRRGSPRLR